MHRHAYGRSTIYFELFDRWGRPYDHVLQSLQGGGEFVVTPLAVSITVTTRPDGSTLQWAQVLLICDNLCSGGGWVTPGNTVVIITISIITGRTWKVGRCRSR